MRRLCTVLSPFGRFGTSVVKQRDISSELFHTGSAIQKSRPTLLLNLSCGGSNQLDESE